VGQELREIDLEHAPQLHERSRRVAFQVWEHGRTLRLHSLNAPEQRMSRRDSGFSNESIDGKRWRVLSTWDAQHRFLVQVGERDDARREIAANIAANLLTPLAFALPALGFLAWLSIARALRPLDGIGRELAARRPDNLAPVAAKAAPMEVTPLVNSLNALFARVSRLIENERRFTADAAHELRTPLAALKTQVQVALGAASDDERRRALNNIVAGCDRAARLVEQLLTLARLDPEQFAGHKETCDLRAIARQTIADLAPMAVAKQIHLELLGESEVVVTGYPALIGILVRNLVDNAVRYSRPDGHVAVEAATEARAPVLAVTDEGPGIPVPDRAKVGQRFYRILGTEESGSGLGLSIVYRIAELHGAAVSLTDGPGGRGLCVRVVFRRD
jgi:two-component system sensor histidine kinase QseC